MHLLTFFFWLRNFVDMNQQINAFKSQLRIANRFKIPIVIHCRNKDLEVFEIIQEVKYLPTVLYIS